MINSTFLKTTGQSQASCLAEVNHTDTVRVRTDPILDTNTEIPLED